jgi:hypothetical protein
VLFGFFTGREPAPGLSAWQLKEGIKKSLFLQGVKAGRLSVLIVDEGQKLTPECLELMRELLNYETNAQKLLQIVVFAQREIEPVLEEMENLLDRVNCYHRLTPLDFAETRAMIRYRLQEAAADKSAPPDLFSNLGYWAVYRASRGYPPRIVRRCPKVVRGLSNRRPAPAGLRLVGRRNNLHSLASGIRPQNPPPRGNCHPNHSRRLSCRMPRYCGFLLRKPNPSS